MVKLEVLKSCTLLEQSCTDLRQKPQTLLGGSSLLNICIFMTKMGAASFEKLLLWESAVYITFTAPLKRVVNTQSLFSLSGFFKLHKVCQLPGWTVLCVSMSPRRARGGRHIGVEIRGREESLPAMPQKLHSRVKALLSRPENRHYSFFCVANICQSKY